MSVLLPNAWLGVQRQGPMTEDSHGTPVPGTLGAVVGPFPGRVRGGSENLQGGHDIELLALDPGCWPCRPRDVVVEYAGNPEEDNAKPGAATGRTWTLRSADWIAHSEDDSVNYVRAQGQVRVGTSTSP